MRTRDTIKLIRPHRAPDPEFEASDAPRLNASIPVRNIALTFLSILAALALLRYARQFFVPLALSMLIAYALNPFVNLLQRVRFPRAIAAAVIVFGSMVLVTYGTYALRHQAVDVVEGLPAAVANVRARMHAWETGTPLSGALGRLQQAAKEIERTTAEANDGPTARGVTRVQITQTPFRATDYLLSGSMGLAAMVSDAVIIMFLVFFILASGNFFKRKIVRMAGTRLSEKRRTVETINQINRQIERFLFVQILTSVAVAVATGLALWAFGMHQPAVWGVAAGFLSSVPFLGPALLTAALTVVAFLQFNSIGVAAEAAMIPIAIFILEGLLVKPAVMGKAASINAPAMFVGLLFWGWIWGLLGMLVAVPLMMVLKSVCDRVERLRPIGELLGDR